MPQVRSRSATASVNGGGLAILRPLTAATVTTTERTLDASVSDHTGDQTDRADRVVVARDDEVNEARIAVRVRDGDDRNAELTRLLDCNRLLSRVDDEHRLGNAGHSLHAADVLLEASALLLELHCLLLEELLVSSVFAHALERTQTLKATLHGAEVGQRASEPAVRDVEHLRPLRLGADDFLGLALGTN